MTRSWKQILVCLMLWLPALPEIWGQQQDFQSWWELDLNKQLGDRFALSGELEQRFRNNSLQYDRTLATITGDYLVNSFLELSGGVRGVAVSDRERRLYPKYRLHIDITGSHAFSGLDLSLRGRVQYGFEDPLQIGFVRVNTLVNRNRLKVAYRIFGTKVGLFGSVESWHLLNDVPSRLTYKMRYSGGVQVDLSFVSRITLRYILEDEFNVKDPLQSHILLIGYRHIL